MKKKVLALVIPLIVFLFVLFVIYNGDDAVRTTSQADELSYNVNPVKKITHMTAGLIKADTLIAARFEEGQVGVENIKKQIDNEGIFWFEPGLKGQVYWADERTIAFEPEKPLPAGSNYTGVLDLKALFPGIEDLSPEKKVFAFESAGQALVRVSGDFEQQAEKDQVVFSGQIVLADKVEPERIKRAVSLLDTGSGDGYSRENLPGSLQEFSLELNTVDGLVFDFKSEAITRTDRERKLSLVLKNEELGLTGEFTREYYLAPVEELTVSRIEEEREADSSVIRIIFSDPLDPELNYTGFINLQPAVNFRTEVEDRALLIRGDFSPGENYRIQLLPGFRGASGLKLVSKREYQLELKISNNYPGVEFVNSGIYLPSAGNKRIAFRTMNLARVYLKVKKVEANNLITFFKENSYRTDKYSSESYDRYGFQRTGEIIESEVLELGSEMNRWIQSEIDLSGLIGDQTNDLYIVQLEYREEDALYFPEDWSGHRISSFARTGGKISKHLIISDLGITVKKSPENTLVIVTDLLEALPVEEATVRLMNSKGEIVETAYTAENGICLLENSAEYLEVRKRYQYAVLKFSETVLDTSLFEVGGIENRSGLKAFIYTDRGVYRPGDRVNVSVIARNEEDSFPADHPIKLMVFNPRNKLVHEESLKTAGDGFYTYSFNTGEAAPTGNWLAAFRIGAELFERIIKIEEIVPRRIEVAVEPWKESLTREDRSIDFAVSAKYLFGSPASGLESISSVRVEPYEVSFRGYSDYTFNNQGLDFKAVESHDIEQVLDEEGRTEISWDLPELARVPSAIEIRIDTRILEKGGRPVQAEGYLPYRFYDRYVGIKSLNQGQVSIGNTARFNVVLLSAEGSPLKGERLKYRIYRRRGYWWWDYSSINSFRSNFKTSVLTELAKEGEVTTGEEPVSIQYEMADYGEMLVEVEDTGGGHTAGYFFRSFWWGDEEITENADFVNLRTDREKYFPGERAKIIVDAPEKGRALVTVEKANRLLYREWHELHGSSSEFELEVREEYVPNAYVSVTIFQPYSGKGNDLPVRLFGIVPLMVEKEDSRLDFEVVTPETIRPGEEFTVKIDSARQARFTIAVVDEGLLNITGFATPDPWDYFFQKERLMTVNYDNLAEVIGLNEGYIYHRFSPGGDLAVETAAEKYRKKQLLPDQTKRFKPVALFAGPVETDVDGGAVVSFTMPEYIGRVRVMVVGAAGGSYGSREEEILVKSPLMVMPTLPRFLGPEDFIEVPVTVFAMEENLGEVRLKLEVDGPLNIAGDAEKVLKFTRLENRDIFFYLSAGAEIGQARIRVSARSAEEEAESNIELAIQPYNPYTYLAEEKTIGEGGEIAFRVPAEGIKNAGAARISIAPRKNLKLNHRLKWLIRYPYGCIEQVTSSVFPQLFIGDLFKLTDDQLREIDRNINQAIAKLREFQLSSGAFSYWPDENYPTQWGTNYAGHFLLEARNRGYFVPADMLKRWNDFQLKLASEYTDNYLTWAYRLYLLSLSGNKPINGMNYLRESKLELLDNTAKYYLAGAYLLAGYRETASEIIAGVDTTVEEYNENWWWSYGSALRNKAIMLDVATLFEDYERALGLYNEIAIKLSSDRWLSTQTSAYSLLAVSRYLQATKTDEDVKGRVILPRGQEEGFVLKKTVFTYQLEDCFGEEVRVSNDSNLPVYATLEWEGIPLKDKISTEAKNLSLTIDWFDDEGRIIDPTALEQGSVFWGVFAVEKEKRGQLNEMALVQLLPAGWEIENLRLTGESLPDWLAELKPDEPEYLDIRDDRIMWFFDSAYYDPGQLFAVKLNAVTVGNFYLPPTVVEAMYDNKYKAVVAGREVRVFRGKEEEQQFNLLKIADQSPEQL